VTTVSLCEPQAVIRTGYGDLFSVSRDREQWWCAAASVKPYWTALLTDRAALIAGWRNLVPAMETRAHADERELVPNDVRGRVQTTRAAWAVNPVIFDE